MGTMECILRRRIEKSNVKEKYMVEKLVADLQSKFPEYNRVRNFSKRVQDILDYSETPPPRKKIKRKKDEAVDGDDDKEDRMCRREAAEHIGRSQKKDGNLCPPSSTCSQERGTSFSTTSDEEFVEPEFDMMKSLLRSSYSSYSKQHVDAEVVNSNTKENKNFFDLDGGSSKLENTVNGQGFVQQEEDRVMLKTKGKYDDDGPRFKDLGGIEAILDELLKEVIFPFIHPQVTRSLGVRPDRGILLYGPPGCGKTKLAHAIANETGVPFYHISSTEVVSGVSGASEEYIRDLFSKAHRTAPSIVFIDEIDAIASKRENLEREMERRIVTQLLTCMDAEPYSRTSGQKSGYVLVIGATNRPEALDPAVRRSGRFDREINLRIPNEKGRAQILSVVTSRSKHEGDIDLEELARSTPGFVGADLASLANTAGILSMKRAADARETEMSEEAKVEGNKDWLTRPWTSEEIERLSITMTDYREAAEKMQPSLTRQGFSTPLNVRWEDVGGLDLLRTEFERYIINRIKHPQEYEEFGVDMEIGVLLYGPPGCGKTLIAMALAKEAGANFIHIKGPEILNKYVGESEKKIQEIFTNAQRCAPCIIFFDEVDALTTKRGEEGGLVVERLLNQLLVELDGAGQRRGVFVIGATNRFGKHIHVPLPGAEERYLILKALARKKPIAKDVDLAVIARRNDCENLSGADLAAVLNEAATTALEEKWLLGPGSHASIIKERHIDQALKKICPSVSAKQKSYYEGFSQSFGAE
ncbi:hypothetical protein AQUCO_00600151v1 [Aquilegia coerulea]|uniref:AAA+ ATPase domain-containing protein n=1 Tax=Aquilegia coerulea TaxID=218851 RepID=A0A2G5ENF5_AQUCA|nr:hypothetical protein AQUCO_00600151v1 [Aquilegia coerulea]